MAEGVDAGGWVVWVVVLEAAAMVTADVARVAVVSAAVGVAAAGRVVAAEVVVVKEEVVRAAGREVDKSHKCGDISVLLDPTCCTSNAGCRGSRQMPRLCSSLDPQSQQGRSR